ncbi:MAG: EcsC family protein [Pirellulales bacterium]|nr:EcsC family protein [Pirellulales bacterium]
MLSDRDRTLLSGAVAQLERPGMAARLAALVGAPVEKLLDRLPAAVQAQINHMTEEALTRALSVAMKTLDGKAPKSPWKLSHKVAATISGVTGGMFGAPALLAELPITTVIILRSIADIARSKGEELADAEARLACLEVFALGSGGENAPGGAVDLVDADSPAREKFIRASYFVARAAMAQQVGAAAEILVKGTGKGSATALTRLIANIASRFGIAVSEKAAAQAIPVIGAVGGGMINAVFIDHFQNTADAHFTVRMLERKYGQQAVRHEYERLASNLE